MYGAVPYLMRAFELGRDDAFRIVCEWIDAQEQEATAPPPPPERPRRRTPRARRHREAKTHKELASGTPLAILPTRRSSVSHIEVVYVRQDRCGFAARRPARRRPGRGPERCGRRARSQRSGGGSGHRGRRLCRLPSASGRHRPSASGCAARRGGGAVRSARGGGRAAARPPLESGLVPPGVPAGDALLPDGRYYDRWSERWPHADEVVVYERGGRYYTADCEHRGRHHEGEPSFSGTTDLP